MTSEPRSPRLARSILGLLLPERYRDNQLGDLEEEFRARGRRDGYAAARRWYWLQAATSLPGTGRLRYREERANEKGRGRGLVRGLVGGWMESMWQNLRHAVRTLIGSPQHTIIATVTLALAIGVNTSIFSIVNQVLHPVRDRGPGRGRG